MTLGTPLYCVDRHILLAISYNLICENVWLNINQEKHCLRLHKLYQKKIGINEYCVFGPADFEYLCELIIENTSTSPDNEWTTFHPFNIKKYKKLFSNPPFKVLQSTILNTINLESQIDSNIITENHMSDIVKSKIQEMNKESLEVISTEAISNPLKTITSIIKNSLHRIVNSLNNNRSGVVEVNKSTTDNYSNFQLVHNENNGRYQKETDYASIKNILVTVPVGFTGDLVGYTDVLVYQTKVMSNISKDVIEQTHNLILKYIGKPDTMSNISNTDFGKIKLHSIEIEKFKKEMNKYFSSKNKNQTLPIGKLIKNLNEFSPLATNIKDTIIPFELDYKTRNNIHKSYLDLQKSLDLLLVRIEQKPEQYNLNKLNAERLANLINDVAVEIELYSALVSYCGQLTECIMNLQNKIMTTNKP